MQVLQKQFTDEELIAALKNGSELAFKQLYRQGYRPIELHITQNSGSVNDAKDLFQEALLVLVKKLREPDFNLSVKPASYLSAVVKKMWLYKLRGSKNKPIVSIDNEDQPFELADEIEETNYEEKHYLMQQVFTTISEDCRKLLNAFYFEKKDMKQIATMMDYTTDFVRLKKFRCMKTFKKKVKEHPSFQTL